MNSTISNLFVFISDVSFETENKIFAQEAGKVTGKQKSNEGTSGVGMYFPKKKNFETFELSNHLMDW